MFLNISFGDNDFGFPMHDALRRLWNYIHENNAHLLKKEALADLFKKLHKCGALLTMVERLFLLEIECQQVEFRTRGLYNTTKWQEHKVTVPTKLAIHKQYFNLRITLLKDKPKKWKNGEHAWVNLETGEVGQI